MDTDKASGITRDGGRITIVGEVRQHNRSELKEQAYDAIIEGHKAVTIDMRECGYLDSSALGVLCSIWREASARGGVVRLEHVHEELRTLFQITKLDEVFEFAGQGTPA